MRALAHAGLLKALDENGIQPSIISGTSGGARWGAVRLWGSSRTDARFLQEDARL